MNSLVLQKTSKAVAWIMAVSMAFAFAVPQAAAFESRGNTSSAKWMAQAPVSNVSGGASIVNANPGDILNFSLTIQNTSPTDVFYSADALLDEPAPYVGAHEMRVGATSDFVYDNIFDFTSGGPFVNNNRFATFQSGPAVFPGQNLTFNWSLKVKNSITPGTYRFKVGVVQEWDAWLGDFPGPGAGGPNNNLGGRNGGTIFWDIVIGGTPTGPGGSLMVSLAGGTPPSASIADGANANFTRLTLTPMGGAVSITSIYVTRSGLSTDNQVENVKLIRASDGVQVGGTAGGFNANHEAQIFFSPALVLSSSTDFFLRAGIDDGATAGNTVALGIAANDDIISNASSVSGAPVTGNQMTIVSLTIGTLTVSEFGSVADDTPDVGAVDVITNTFQVSAGSTEDVWIEQISALRVGSAASDDTVNIELVNDTTGVPVGTIASWSDNRATWNFSPALRVTQGSTIRFTIRLDVVDGSGLTVNTDVTDGSDVLVVARGDLYGYYLTPTVGTWTGTSGQGDASQTINSGALIISKSASSAPTGNIAIAPDQNIGTWDFDTRGEDMRISALSVDLGGTITEADDVSNARIYDENGNIVAGPIDASADGGTALNRELDFTQTFIAPVGIHKFTLKVTIDTTAADGETLTTTITAAGDVTVKGVRTNETITPSVGGAALNTQTVNGAALVSTTLTSPVARSIALGASDFVFMTASLDAGSSGEDVRVTAMQVSVDTANEADPDAIINMELWADLTAANSSRGDAFETQISSATQPSGANAAAADVTYSVNLSTPLTITKGTSRNIAFVADVQAGGFTAAGANDTVTVYLDTDASDITAVGLNSGTAITTAPTGTGQAMTVVSAGTLTLTTDTTSPLAQIVVGGATMQKAGVFRVAADNVENIELDELVFEPALTGADDVTLWSVYSNRDANGNLVGGNGVLLGTAPSTSATAFTITVADGTSTVPANGHALITVYANVSAVDGSGVVNGDNLQIGIDGDAGDDLVDGTGKASGAAASIAAYDDLDSNTHEIMKSKLTITVAATSPSGNLIPGTLTNVAEFSFTADAAADISFRSGSDDLFSVQLDVVAFDVDDTGTDEVRLVRKSTGVTLDADTATFGGDGDLNAGSSTTQFDFNFSSAALTVAAGTTEVVQIKVDTDDLGSAGDSIRAWIDDTAADVTHGTEGGDNEVALGAIIARGDIQANVLVKP